MLEIIRKSNGRVLLEAFKDKINQTVSLSIKQFQSQTFSTEFIGGSMII